MSRFETVMISRARTEKISTLEQEFEAELKQLGKENAKGGKFFKSNFIHGHQGHEWGSLAYRLV